MSPRNYTVSGRTQPFLKPFTSMRMQLAREAVAITYDKQGARWRDVLTRLVLFLWAVCVACPVRYWPISPWGDNTWVFAVNYAIAHGLAIGRDVVWTTGPLGHLAFPIDIGHNLATALQVQYGLWLVLAVILADLYFRVRIPVPSLALFTCFFALSAPIYWFNYVGLDYLLVSIGLMGLTIFRWYGGWHVYIISLVLLGLAPLIKFSAGFVAAGALAGFVVHLVWQSRGPARLSIALALVIPCTTSVLVTWWTLPSKTAIIGYVTGSLRLASGYSAAMSIPGEWLPLCWTIVALSCLVFLVAAQYRQNRAAVWYIAALLTAPLAISLKHGIVRQDVHILVPFCFVGMALGLVCLSIRQQQNSVLLARNVLLVYLVLWFQFAGMGSGPETMLDGVAESVGFRAVSLALKTISLDKLSVALRKESEAEFPAAFRLEPEIRALIGRSSVASLSVSYSAALLDDLNLTLYPVLQRYSAYTPELDKLNAESLSQTKPVFLLFDGSKIDGRHPWAETPALWLEVFRWYDTCFVGPRNLLLRRRSTPRFGNLISRHSLTVSPQEGFSLPEGSDPLFWTMRCNLTPQGRLRNVLFRLPAVMMRSQNGRGGTSNRRVIPAVLVSPLPARLFPNTLQEIATLLSTTAAAQTGALRVSFEGPGLAFYESACAVELLSPQ